MHDELDEEEREPVFPVKRGKGGNALDAEDLLLAPDEVVDAEVDPGIEETEDIDKLIEEELDETEEEEDQW